jgi:hypothetical protein
MVFASYQSAFAFGITVELKAAFLKLIQSNGLGRNQAVGFQLKGVKHFYNPT